MAAAEQDFTVERGIQFRRQVTVNEADNTPFDLTGTTIEAFIRTSQLPTEFRAFPAGTGPKVAEFTTDLADDPTTGIFTFSLSADDTLLLERGNYDYDIVLTFTSGDKRRVLKGILTAIEITTHVEV